MKGVISKERTLCLGCRRMRVVRFRGVCQGCRKRLDPTTLPDNRRADPMRKQTIEKDALHELLADGRHVPLPYVRHLCRRIAGNLGSKVDPKDLEQTAYVVLIANAAHYRPTSPGRLGLVGYCLKELLRVLYRYARAEATSGLKEVPPSLSPVTVGYDDLPEIGDASDCPTGVCPVK